MVLRDQDWPGMMKIACDRKMYNLTFHTLFLVKLSRFYAIVNITVNNKDSYFGILQKKYMFSAYLVY